ncbi:hypothetical protein [Actinoplanes lobatus]|uniref:Uncharacterized protein n=1 Tax=Actinoplanes lobatus TaxID=113568 RepID=A0A7W7HMU2_9ACTN|nr:hypothetical protein [Actinoplanes lobatus]MBB4753428.1 hypothetical protein [Actinoplanes lobatus]
MNFDIQPVRVPVPESALIDLRRRPTGARWPEESPAGGWEPARSR